MPAAPKQIATIADYHRLVGLPGPEHPLISVVRFEDMVRDFSNGPGSFVQHFYCVALKHSFNARLRYGQQAFDFDAGVMVFLAPRQVLAVEGTTAEELNHTGWLLLIHPDFFRHTPLARKIQQYEYFDYRINEALHLSEKEEETITGIMRNIAQEYSARIDRFSDSVILAHVELLLTYAERFYQRQFITRRFAAHEMLARLEEVLAGYFAADQLAINGIPSVQAVADALHLSPAYLSRLLKTLTGQSTKELIQDKLMEVAKEKLSTTDLSVSEIAYELGFAHPQSFNKLFRTKTKSTPIAFRRSFN